MSQRPEPGPLLPRRPLRVLTALAATVVLAAMLALIPTTPAGADTVSDWLGLINNFRAQNGLSALQYDGQLSGLATQQAQVNASNGALAHTPNLAAGVTANWSKLGENVGMGGTTDVIWNAFLNSGPHRANLLDPAFTHVGIGVVMSGNTQWVTHRFMGVPGGPAPTAPPVTAAPQPQPQPQPEPEPPPVYVPPPTVAPTPRVTTPAPAPTVPVPVTVPAPQPVVVPAAAAPDRSATLLDALHGIDY